MAVMKTGVTEERGLQNMTGFILAVLAAAAVFVPPIVYQVRHFDLPWTDVGTYSRSLWNVFELGKFVVYSDGDSDFFIWQHFEPFFFLLCVPVRIFGTLGYVTLITGALVLSSAFVFLLSARICARGVIGILAAAAFVANPYTYAIALSYHIETFGILFLLAFAYYSHAGRTGMDGPAAWPLREGGHVGVRARDHRPARHPRPVAAVSHVRRRRHRLLRGRRRAHRPVDVPDCALSEYVLSGRWASDDHAAACRNGVRPLARISAATFHGAGLPLSGLTAVRRHPQRLAVPAGLRRHADLAQLSGRAAARTTFSFYYCLSRASACRS